jgi:hypothetical protein
MACIVRVIDSRHAPAPPRNRIGTNCRRELIRSIEIAIHQKYVAGKPATADTWLTNANGASCESLPFPCPYHVAFTLPPRNSDPNPLRPREFSDSIH